MVQINRQANLSLFFKQDKHCVYPLFILKIDKMDFPMKLVDLPIQSGFEQYKPLFLSLIPLFLLFTHLCFGSLIHCKEINSKIMFGVFHNIYHHGHYQILYNVRSNFVLVCHHKPN